ncbi:MAG TPA: bifunctional diguanylate cyclase/phosphodiesterase [Sphingomicrobium sp.]|nr:bifunctional diguanylate cyclase/phosphodiesterase [Sphingomicrobium sp.]
MTIAIAIGAMVIVSLFLAGAGVYWATHESDAVSVERQARSAQHAMESSVDELALQQETVAIWDDSAEHLVAPRLDATWVHDNMGSWLHRIFGHDEVFVVDGFDRPLYASVEGQQVSLKRYAALSPDLVFLVNSVRGRDGGSNGRHDRNPRRALAADSTVRTTPRTTHDSHIMLVGGRPAAASAMLVQPSTRDFVRPNGQWPVLISVRYLDRGFLAELSSRQLISSPRFSREAQRLGSEHAIVLKTEWGKAIGYLIWKPELPGTRILWKLVPFNLLILLGLASLMIFLGRRLHHAAGELASAEANAAHLAFHDSLTGLPNRAMFQRKLEELTGDGADPNFALALLDVDEFKLTNDTLGHDAGDAVLLTFADRLKSAIRSDDLVARLGGDEFAILLMGMSGADELETFSHKLLEQLREPVEHQGKVIHCNASIGASSCGGGDDAHNMLKHADLALYEAKGSGRGAYRLYDPAMWSDMLLRREMLSVAEAALEGDFIRPHYQPKVELETGAIIGFEALLRCCLPGQPAKGPECVAAAFEDSALAVRLSDRMVDEVIKDISAWRAGGLDFGHVAINAALAELRRGDFAGRLLAKLEGAQIPPECIQVEVTESVLLGQGIDHVERTFNELAAKGIRLALDDFGTGFASLTHLKRFPIEIIKIDRSFVRDLQIDAEDGAIVDALIGLGKALRIEVVAEGIETSAQRDFLSSLGCAIGQGYLFGSACPAANVPGLLRKPDRKADRAAAA